MGTKEIAKEHDTFPAFGLENPQKVRAHLHPWNNPHGEKRPRPRDGHVLQLSRVGQNHRFPTEETYQKLKLGYVAEELKKKGLLP